jgi:AraC-like DNA-binding protein
MASTWTTRHFEEWEHHLSQAIGHHSSTLLTPEVPFASRMTLRQAEGVAAVALEGESSLRLHRWQPRDQLVLWLPQHGWVQDRINGQELVAEPGTAMLCLPGDELLGVTSSYLKGVSILLPATALGAPSRWQGFSGRHLAEGSEVRALIDTAHQLVAALAAGAPEAPSVAGILADHLLFWRDLAEPQPSDRSLGTSERRRQLRRARDWIEAHLHEPLRVTDLAEALNLSTRSLQFCFRQETGHSPLEEIRRLRFRRLRQLLGTTLTGEGGLVALYRQCGLTPSAFTRRQYRQWCGETPAQSRFRAGLGPADPPG